MVVYDYANARAILTDLGDLCSVDLSCYCAITLLVMSNIGFRDAAWNEVVLPLMPNPLHRSNSSRIIVSSAIELILPSLGDVDLGAFSLAREVAPLAPKSESKRIESIAAAAVASTRIGSGFVRVRSL
jgi:hypothetical protein